MNKQPETPAEAPGQRLLPESRLLAGGEQWNKCDVCGRFISMCDFDSGKAVRRMITPDSAYSTEEYETLCRTHKTVNVTTEATAGASQEP